MSWISSDAECVWQSALSTWSFRMRLPSDFQGSDTPGFLLDIQAIPLNGTDGADVAIVLCSIEAAARIFHALISHPKRNVMDESQSANLRKAPKPYLPPKAREGFDTVREILSPDMPFSRLFKGSKPSPAGMVPHLYFSLCWYRDNVILGYILTGTIRRSRPKSKRF